jgi:hypothetical protein
MSALSGTFMLFVDAAREALTAFGRTWLAMLALVAGNFALLAAIMLISPLPAGIQFVAGFGIALLLAGAVGWYLALVSVGVVGRRKLRLTDMRGALGHYLWDVIGIMFLFWIASLVLGFTVGAQEVIPLGGIELRGPWIVAVLFAIANVLFNPAPEMVYQEHARSTELLSQALQFMQQNWPEWLVAHAIAMVVLVSMSVGVWGAPMSQEAVMAELDVFGPQFGFIFVGAKAVGLTGLGLFGLSDPGGALSVSSSAVRIGAGIGLLAFTHYWMLFRGVLYSKLRGSSRRARAWQSRLR